MYSTTLDAAILIQLSAYTVCSEQHILFLFKIVCLSVIIEIIFQRYAFNNASN
jgi:hypothetical protein